MQLRMRFRVARGGQVTASQGTSLPRCSNAELATLQSLIREYQVVFRLAVDSETIDELLPYKEPYHEWRVDFWSHLPACTEAFEAGLRIARASSLVVAYYAFEIAGYPIKTSHLGTQIGIDSYFMFNWLILLDKGDRAAIDEFMESPFTSGI